MKLIVGYVRNEMITHVTEALAAAGCHDFSVVDARRVVAGLRGENYDFSVMLGERFETMQRLEIICLAELAPIYSEALRRAAHTGRHGDGAIFVLPVEDAIRISDGVRGRAALPPSLKGPA